jgi:hypothetical protein
MRLNAHPTPKETSANVMRKLLIFVLFALSMASGFAASFASFPPPAQTPDVTALLDVEEPVLAQRLSLRP